MKTEITYVEKFKLIVYKAGVVIGSITKNPTQDKYRFNEHGVGKGPWMMSVEAVKVSIEYPTGEDHE